MKTKCIQIYNNKITYNYTYTYIYIKNITQVESVNPIGAKTITETKNPVSKS